MISIETARDLLDFQGGTATQQARISRARADEQLAGAVALHNILDRHRVAYLADEVGLGKTYVALGAFALFRHFNPHFRLLVIAPKENIQKKWMKEMDNFVRNNVKFADLRVRSIHGTPAHPPVYCENLHELARETSLDPDRDFFVRLTSFGFGLAEDNRDGWVKKRERLQALLPWIDDELLALNSKTRFKENYARAIGCAIPKFDLVIVDEGHNLKHGLHKDAALRNRLLALVLGHDPEGDGATRKKLPHYGPRAKRVLFLSATPVEDDYRHIWNQMNVVGFGDVAPLLADKTASDEEKRAVLSQFLIRRVSQIRAQDTNLTKNLYRREWKNGGVAAHDEPLPNPGNRQRLLVALVQKKVSELLADERFNQSFQIGMLASFESFLQTTKTLAQDIGNFDDAEQTDDDLEREGLDVHSVNQLAKSYRQRFGTPMPHPKMDALVDSLKETFDTGRKALVFVRRVASVKEIEEKLESEYDAWLEKRLHDELPDALGPRIDGLFEQYRQERAARQRVREATAAEVDEPELEEVAEAAEDQGGNDTFFAWFFRGKGPEATLSGAALAKRFQQPQFALSSFFDDNYVSGLLGARPGGVFQALCAYLRKPADIVQAELERRAGRHVRTEQRRRRHRHVFRAFQAAAISLIAEHPGDLHDEAELILHAIVDDGHADAPPLVLGDWLERATFFTELRAREGLFHDLWVPTAELALTVDQRFRRRELRRELIASMFRLGHSLIDLYVTIIRRRNSIERASDTEDLDNSVLANDLLDLLEQQKSSPVFRAYSELREAASNFDLIVDVNAHSLWQRQLSEVPRGIGNLLGEQQPIGGMSGQVNETLVKQFRMPGYPFVLITTDLLQEGEDLHLFCSDVYHYGIAWMPSSMEQRIGRIDRVRSHTERRLTSIGREPDGHELLQVYYPFLRETIEVFQVNRVLDRMDRFMRLMHEGLSNGDEGADRRINLLDEIHRAPAPRTNAAPAPLRTAFPVRPEWIDGRKGDLAVARETHDEIVQRFRLVQEQLQKSDGISWEQRSPNSGRIGRMRVGDREQSFTIFLHSIGGRPLVRCVSPVGAVEPEENLEQIVRAARPLHAHVAAVYDPRFRDYKLTAEADVLLGDMDHDHERVRWLIRATASAADRLEEVLLQIDAAAGEYHDGMQQEPGFER